MDKASTIDTSLRMLTGDCIATVKKKILRAFRQGFY